MRFARLHDDGGYPLFVNAELIESVVRRGTRGGGAVVYVAGRPIHVEEAPEDVARILEVVLATESVERQTDAS